MEQENFVKEILNALKLHGDHMDRKFDQIDQRFEQIDQRFEQLEEKFDNRFGDMETRLDRVEKKMDGFRVELTETQEDTNYLLSKNAQHEKKLHQLFDPHQ